ncbi:MAG: hypothetical protein ACRDJ3_09645 [Solirubrobacteraceae bacterium]
MSSITRRQKATSHTAGARKELVVKRSRVAVPLVAMLLAALTAGCGSKQTITAAATLTPPATQPVGTPTTTPASANTVRGTIQDEQGDHAVFSIGIGLPAPLEKLSDPVATACNHEIVALGQSISSTIAISLHVTARLTSSLKVPLSINLNETGSEVQILDTQHQGITALKNIPSLAALWATAYSNGEAVCNSTAAQVQWQAEAITPNAAQTWTTWLILVGAITPHDPTGQRAARRLLLTPRVVIGNASASDLTPQGQGWVRCSANEPGYAAVDPHVQVPSNACA